MIEMNEALFLEYSSREDIPVLVEFWAPWCGYCRRIIPALEAVAEKLEGKLEICRVNIDNEPGLEEREQIEVIPTLVIYQGGKALGSMVAPESRGRIESFIRETLQKEDV